MDMIGCDMRLICEDGVIELGVDDGPALRYRTDGSTWRTVSTKDSIHAPDYSLPRAGLRKVAQNAPFVSDRLLDRPTFYERAIEEVVEALREDREPEISGRNALAGTELTYASWESARRRGRVDLPLDIEDNPLDTLFGDEDGETDEEESNEPTVSADE
jgi:predicted dehydrogenase